MDVVVALIFDKNNHVLITQRPLDKTHGGMWEFPGGKMEEGETGVSALKREIKEEVGLDILSAHLIREVRHAYTDFSVRLFIYRIDSFEGEAQCLESQPGLKWAATANLEQYDFPKANYEIIRMLKDQSTECLDLAHG